MLSVVSRLKLRSDEGGMAMASSPGEMGLPDVRPDGPLMHLR